MAYVYALINKDTLHSICEQKRITVEFLKKRTHFDAEKITLWITPSDKTLPTIRQAKKLANCMHIPFAGLYMNPEQIPMKKIPNIKNNENYNNAFLFCATLVLLLLNYKNTRLFGVRTENYKRMESFVQSKVDSSVSNDGSAGIPILNMTQDSQMNYFFNKTYYDNTFRNIILNEQGENSREIEDKVLSEHPAATVYKGMPCVFLMDLDIENFYHIMKYSIFLKVSYYFVCFEKHKEVIEATVKAIYQYHDIDIESKVVSIEEIIKNYDVSL